MLSQRLHSSLKPTNLLTINNETNKRPSDTPKNILSDLIKIIQEAH